jgi:hypothetical protein
MKTLISYVAVAALILMSSFTINVQQQLNEQTNSCFNFLRIHRQAKNVAMTWSVSSTDVVQFVVQRSYDGEFFENIGTVNFAGSASYKFTDDSVFPGRIYYRITAVKTDMSTECSSTEDVRIVQRG